MQPIRRVGTGLLLTGAAALAALMAYTLTIDVYRPVVGPPIGNAAEVAVFLTQPDDWDSFCQGIRACATRGLVRPVGEEPGAVVVETPRRRRSIRFTWQKVPGVVQARDELRRLLAEPSPPVAVVGSDNTVLTTALAQELSRSRPSDGPVLLVPWATTVQTAPLEGGGPPVRLLEIYAGRTFRLCPDNQRLADLVVRCLAAHEPSARPDRVVIEVDRADPYSIDLAGHFRRTIAECVPGAVMVSAADPVAPIPQTATEDGPWARGIWEQVRAAGPGRTTWLVLPLQNEPALRRLRALRSAAARADRPEGGRLRVLCGDGIGADSLAEFAGFDGFSVWCGTAATAIGPEHRAQVPGEIVAALAWALDEGGDDPEPAAIRATLAGLRWDEDHPSALGRSLAFEPSGERSGDDLGGVVATRPERAEVVILARSGDGRWAPPARMRNAASGMRIDAKSP